MGNFGILLVGLGAVSTTTIAGVMADPPRSREARSGRSRRWARFVSANGPRVARRAIKDFVPLASLDDVVFGGWDIFDDNSYEAAKTAGVLENDAARPDPAGARAIKPMSAVFDRRYVKRLDGPNVKKGTEQAGSCRAADRRHPPLQEGQRTAPPRADLVRAAPRSSCTETPAHASVAAFEKALEANDESIPSSMIYAYAAIKEGIPYANAAPNLSADVPALLELARRPAHRSPARI